MTAERPRGWRRPRRTVVPTRAVATGEIREVFPSAATAESNSDRVTDVQTSPAPPAPIPGQRRARGGRGGAFFVAAGILLSRLLGLIRTSAFARYLGAGDPADAFNAAFRIPNFLQNLFGEGVLSASFIPVYAGLLARGDQDEAGRVAGAVVSLLALVLAVLALLGVVFAPGLLFVLAPGFGGAKRDLTIELVRILFPGAAVLALSAWCLGILNSHRRFFLSYAAPVAWNVTMIAALLGLGSRLGSARLVVYVAWASVVGSALQFGVQLPMVLRLVPRLRLTLAERGASVRAVVTNFLPALVGRGVAQISAFIDAMLASLLGTGAVTIMNYAQTVYILPISLFGMAISAAELPAMSSAVGSADEIAAHLRGRLESGLSRIAFFIVASAMGFVAFGDVIAGLLFQRGAFTARDATWVWGTLAGSAVGLLASTMGRLYSSAFYALRDTRTPLRFAVIRVILTSALGYICAVHVPPLVGLSREWGTAGLTASAGAAAWVEFVLLRRALSRRIGRVTVRAERLLTLWAVALAGAIMGFAAERAVGAAGPVLRGVAVLATFAVVYVGVAARLAIPEARDLLHAGIGMVRRAGRG